jgi:SAM-dependent methyltransferase
MEDFYWENNIYNKGLNLNKYPFDNVVSFVFRNRNNITPNNVLDIGCGAGNNSWFLAKEGFNVYGIDGSISAINYCRDRFISENLKGDFTVGNFKNLPFKDSFFDLAIDRASLTCCNLKDCRIIVKEINRTLKTKGKFFFNCYGVEHSSMLSGKQNKDGTWSGMKRGAIAGVENIYFFKKEEIYNLFKDGWNILSIVHKEHTNLIQGNSTHSEWEVIVEKL